MLRRSHCWFFPLPAARRLPRSRFVNPTEVLSRSSSRSGASFSPETRADLPNLDCSFPVYPIGDFMKKFSKGWFKFSGNQPQPSGARSSTARIRALRTRSASPCKHNCLPGKTLGKRPVQRSPCRIPFVLYRQCSAPSLAGRSNSNIPAGPPGPGRGFREGPCPRQVRSPMKWI